MGWEGIWRVGSGRWGDKKGQIYMLAMPKTLPSAEVTHTLYGPASTSCSVPNILHPTHTGAGGTGMRGTKALNASAPSRFTCLIVALVPSRDAAGQAVGSVAVLGGRLYTCCNVVLGAISGCG